MFAHGLLAATDTSSNCKQQTLKGNRKMKTKIKDKKTRSTFRTRVQQCRWCSVGVPKCKVRVTSVVPSLYWAPESCNRSGGSTHPGVGEGGGVGPENTLTSISLSHTSSHTHTSIQHNTGIGKKAKTQKTYHTSSAREIGPLLFEVRSCLLYTSPSPRD